MKQIKIEDAEHYLNMDTEDPALQKIDEDLAKGFDLTAVVEAHREELRQLNETDAFLDIVKAEYDRRIHARQAVEMIYTAKMDLLYHLARRFHPLTTYGKEMLDRAIECRREFETIVGPLVTAITGENIYDYRELVPLRFADEIRCGKSRGIGIFRCDMNVLHAAGAVIYDWDNDEENRFSLLRVKWLQVHPGFRRFGVCQQILGELVSVMIRRNANGITLDMPVSDDLTVIGNLLTEWHFSFAPLITPESVCFLRDIKNRREFMENKLAAHPLSALKPGLQKTLIRGFFASASEANADAFLSVPKGYYDEELSCFCKNKNGCCGLLLVHKVPGKQLLVEFAGTTADVDERKCLSHLLIHCALLGLEKYDRQTELVIRVDSEEKRELCEEIFPNQRVRFYVEALLTGIDPEEDMDRDAVEALLAASPEELNRSPESLEM